MPWGHVYNIEARTAVKQRLVLPDVHKILYIHIDQQCTSYILVIEHVRDEVEVDFHGLTLTVLVTTIDAQWEGMGM